MSLIDKLSIQGIRSFPPDRPQKLDFIRPVTLIVGANGTGKTTIIECLKYATTGELPPGAKTNGSFVHDPKLAGEATIRAKVGLQLIDVFKQPMVVTRSLEATQKQHQRNVTIRTLDATVKRKLANGQVQSINQKCTSLDAELAVSLGVSKPVLEYVIFCHQEESNWPLMEGKLVKQRFDEIFASARYVKALDEIRGLKKEYDVQVKSADAELAHLRQVKEEAETKARDLEGKRTRLATYEEEKRKVTERLEPLEAALARYEEQMEQVNRLQAMVDSGRDQRAKLAQDIEEQRAGIDELFEGDDQQLEERLAAAAHEDGQIEERLTRIRRELDRAKAEETALEAQAQALSVELGRLQQERDRAAAVSHEADHLAERLTVKMNAECGNDSTEDANVSASATPVDRVLWRLDGEMRRLESRSRRLAEEAERELADLERRLAVASDERSRVRQRIESASAQSADAAARARRLRAETAEAERAAGRLGDLRGRLSEAEAQLVDVEAEANMGNNTSNISGSVSGPLTDLQSEADRLQSELDAADLRLEAAVRDAAGRAEAAAARKELAGKLGQLERLRNRHGDELSQLLGAPIDPSAQLKRRFLEAQSVADQEARKAESALAEVRCEVGRAETELSHVRQQHGTLDAERRKLEERLYNACGGRAADAVTAAAEAEELRARAEDEKALLRGELQVYRSFLEKVRCKPAGQAACGLCDRRFADSAELRDHIDRLESLAERLPARLREAEAAAAKAAKRCEELLLLRPASDRLAELTSREVPVITEKLSSVEGRLAEARRSAAELERRATERRATRDRCQALESDVRAMDSLAAEAAALRQRCGSDQEEGKSEIGEASDSLADMQEQRRRLKADMDAASAALRAARREAERRAERRHAALDRVNRLRAEQLAAEGRLREAARLADEVSRLEAEAAEASARADTERKLTPRLDAAVAELETERTRLRRRRQTEEAAAKAAWEAVAADRARLDSLRREAAAYAEGDSARRLERQTRRLAGVCASREGAAAEAKRLAESAEAESRARYARDALRKDLEACRRLRQLERRLAQLDAELAANLAQLTSLDAGGADAKRRYPRMRREEETLREERTRLESRRCELNGQVRELEKDLDKELFKTAADKYQKKMSESRVKDLCSQDLATYYKALDWAICQYHTEKMTEVNKLIRDLWRATYRGSDIDYIEIRSDEDASGVAKARRVYNYRVVMCKSGAVMDMRGRCSAGQKVLCSLIVRLALAEAFCHNCGILALDEPTTNLDRENIESLANSLSDIIRTRATQQKNFHMIVITHDEEFVELLGRSEFVDHFFRVQSSPTGHSEIHKRKVEELHVR